MNSKPSTYIETMQDKIEVQLKASLSTLEGIGASLLIRMVRHHLGWIKPEASRGKRLRPLLALLCCDAAGGHWQSALPAAGAIEWIHNFSLIHDDIEDRSETRRGRETVWKRWGIAQATNTGDALFALAHILTYELEAHGHDSATILSIQKQLDKACLHLTIGQHLDLKFEETDNVTEDEYLEMIEGKTAALIAASCEIGALTAHDELSKIALYRKFGRDLGMSFQIHDDLLGIWGTPDVTGKPSGDDLRVRKKTLPIIFALNHSDDFQELWNSDEIDDNWVSRMITALNRAKAREYAEEATRRWTDSALEALTLCEPTEHAASELATLTQKLLSREK
ncbi:MAG: polyprenyl synthetase family protein [Anaerolineales bacterium]|nr:polyprenyl synthetase family protein [Anaerolineales bacterium]MCK5633780.1 polyprenyl synthetase family protein [Anaerolineales bacterium]